MGRGEGTGRGCSFLWPWTAIYIPLPAGLQLENARHMQRAAAVQTQQSARSLKTRSQSMGTPPLQEQLRRFTLAGVAEGGPSDAVTSRAVPTQLAKAVPAHDGGCLTCAFDR